MVTVNHDPTTTEPRSIHMQNQPRARPSRLRTGLLTAALAGGAIVGVGQIAGVVSAQTDDTETAAPSTDTSTDDGTDTTVAGNTDDTGTVDEGDGTDVGRRERREAERAEHAAMDQELADLLGIDAETLREELRGGATLAELAEENGVAVDSVVDLLVEQGNQRIDEAVDEGRLDAAQADEKRAELEERVTTRVNEGGGGRGEGRGPGRRGPGGCEDGDAGDAAGDPSDDAADDATGATTEVAPTATTGAAVVVDA